MNNVRLLVFSIALLALLLPVLGDDIITMPTANMLKGGQVEAAYYHVELPTSAPQPENIQVQCLYIGATDWLELDAQRMAVDNDETSVLLVGYLKLMSESPTTPDLVFACRNMAAAPTTFNPPLSAVDFRALSANQSYSLCAAKTFFFGHGTDGHLKAPLIRLHAALGTADWTLGLEKRHQGLFGGLQALITPYLGICALDDGTDPILGVSVAPGPPGLVIRAGKFGDDWYAGVAYRRGGMW